MLTAPVLRNSPGTVLRNAAMTSGAAPLLTWEASSLMATSRT